MNPWNKSLHNALRDMHKHVTRNIQVGEYKQICKNENDDLTCSYCAKGWDAIFLQSPILRLKWKWSNLLITMTKVSFNAFKREFHFLAFHKYKHMLDRMSYYMNLNKYTIESDSCLQITITRKMKVFELTLS